MTKDNTITQIEDVAHENNNEVDVDVAYTDGYVEGLITARYYALRYPKDEAFFAEPAPLDPPDVVVKVLESICRHCLRRHLFEEGWNSLDELLLSYSREQVQAKFEWMLPNIDSFPSDEQSTPFCLIYHDRIDRTDDAKQSQRSPASVPT